MNALKKLTLPLLGLALVGNSLQSAAIITEDFSSYTANQDIASSTNWNAKWQTGTDQQNLYKASGSGSASLDLGIATNNYHATHQTGFSLRGTDTATISLDIRATHNGGGNTAPTNKGFFGLGFSTQNQWWDNSGTRVDARLANRNGALGMPIAQDPWVEGWVTWNSLGVDPNGGVDSTSDWITEELTISISGGTYWSQAVLKDASGTVLFTGTGIDTGVASDTVIYATMTNGYSSANGDGSLTTEAYTNINSIEVDNFVVNLVPEPRTYAMILGLLVLGFVCLRRIDS